LQNVKVRYIEWKIGCTDKEKMNSREKFYHHFFLVRLSHFEKKLVKRHLVKEETEAKFYVTLNYNIENKNV